MKFLQLPLGLLALAAFQAPLPADVVIDNFAAQTTLIKNGPGIASRNIVAAGILGNQRYDEVNVPDSNGAMFGSLSFDGALTISQGPTDRIFGSLQYNGILNSPFDLTEGGANNALFLNVQDTNGAALNGVFSIEASSDMSSFPVVGVGIPANTGLPQVVSVPFASFAGVDFSQLRYLALHFDFANHPGRTVTLGFFTAGFAEAVPEPSGLVLPCAAVVLLARWRRRR